MTISPAWSRARPNIGINRMVVRIMTVITTFMLALVSRS
jgi:hypothetical protein